jgi:nicotinamide-nucleotide amidase
LANFSEGVTVRITVKSSNEASASQRLAAEEAAVRAILGDVVYGLDGETIEAAIGSLLIARHLSLAVAESFTGGLLASRLVATPGASAYFKGGIVAYDAEVKFSVLGVERGPVISPETAIAMADGVGKLLGADVAIATTGVAGPDSQEGHEPGTAYIAIAVPGEATVATAMATRGSRARVREYAALRAMHLLRQRLLAE